MFHLPAEVVTVGLVPLWVATLFLIVKLAQSVPSFLDRLLEMRRIRAEEKAADWSRLREEINRLRGQMVEQEDRFTTRLRDLEAKQEECERDRREWMDRAIRAEAFQHGQGDVRQAAAVAVATVRQEAKRADEKKEEGGQ